ncbi:MAG: low affinity iron permease family protein [Pseudonocardiales bacterium]|nr:low affinity iron permease family protein [Pseudonocardiales bacterium]MBV9650853.1 low affinity iron permease family protein [Pseudonocardiales bacterium]
MTAGQNCRKSHNGAMMPSDVTGTLSVFDRFAARASDAASRAWFFTLCVLVVVLWAPSVFVLRNIDTWQLIINTITTIITFLLVALLQNSQKRADQATQHKLNAIADGLSDLMKQLANEYPMLGRDCDELREAVGLEQRESAVSRKGT